MAGAFLRRKTGEDDDAPASSPLVGADGGCAAAIATRSRTLDTHIETTRPAGRLGLAGEQVITNARIVTADDTILGTLHVMGGRILALDDSPSHLRSAVDLEGDLLLPGFVDVHTDNLERHLEPRPGVRWPAPAALLAHDRQMLGAGVTTVFDSLCIGDRQRGHARRPKLLADSVNALHVAERDGLLEAHHFLHLRCEVSSHSVVPAFLALVDNPRVRLVSLMDHTPGQRQWKDLEAWRRINRELGEAELAEIRATRRDSPVQTSAARQEIASACRLRGLPIASHDDETDSHVREAVALGVSICEFPTTARAASTAQAAGMRVVMGAPNVVLGHSHSGNVSAREVFATGLVDALASDYVPTSLLHACFALADVLGVPLPDAVAAASAAPAAMSGLHDRGEIAPGRLADLVRVRRGPSGPVVRAVWREGVAVV